MALPIGLVSAGASLLSGFMGNSAAEEAAETQAAAHAQAMQFLQKHYRRIGKDTKAYRRTGTDAMNYLSGLLLGDFSSYQPPGSNDADIRRLTKERNRLRGLQEQAGRGGGGGDGYLPYGMWEARGEGSTLPRWAFGGGGGGTAFSAADRRRLRELDAEIAALEASNVPGERASLDDFYTSPGYQFRVGEGEKGLENMLARRGMGLSGRAMKEMERFRQGIASDEFGSHVGRIMDLGSLGLSGTNTFANTGAGLAGSMANTAISGGQAQAQAGLAGSNYLAQGLQGAANNYMTANALQNNPYLYNPQLGSAGSPYGRW